MYSKIYDIVVDKFIEKRDSFWEDLDNLNESATDFKEVKKGMEKMVERTKELIDLEDIMDFLHSKIY